MENPIEMEMMEMDELRVPPFVETHGNPHIQTWYCQLGPLDQLNMASLRSHEARQRWKVSDTFGRLSFQRKWSARPGAGGLGGITIHCDLQALGPWVIHFSVDTIEYYRF